MRNSDVSLDLETLGTAPGSVITQIGVCAFGPSGRGAAANFYIHPQSCLDLGMTVSWSTIRWWLGQSDIARNAMIGSSLRFNMPISLALAGLNTWLIENVDADFRIWGNGACFDVVLLEDAYRRAGGEVPWSYRNIRDIRTLLEVSPVTKEPSENAHIAMEDAITQARWIMQAQAQMKRETA